MYFSAVAQQHMMVNFFIQQNMLWSSLRNALSQYIPGKSRLKFRFRRRTLYFCVIRLFFIHVKSCVLFLHTCRSVIGHWSREFLDLVGKIEASSSRHQVLEIDFVPNAGSFSYRGTTVNIVKPHLYLFWEVYKIASSICKYIIAWKGRNVVFYPYWNSN